ncbi:MAG TPA: malate synthase A, partial [Candidatus Nesterenkonia stercoripullorum]|nr:malate synthase A [Candidatus Nesterenkonia stercoripullorum]
MSVEVTQPYEVAGSETILTPEALAFVEELHRRFADTRQEVLSARKQAQQQAAESGTLDFPAETQASVREADWTVAEQPEALRDR